MNTTGTMTIACMKMFVRNRQALFFSLFMPLMILFIFGNIDFDKTTPLHLGIIVHAPSSQIGTFVDQLRARSGVSVDEGTKDEELKALRDGDRAAVIELPENLLPPLPGQKPPELTVYVNSSKPMDSGMAMAMIGQFGDKATLAAAKVPMLFTVREQSISVRNFRYIEFLLPGVIAMAIMQMSVFSVAFVFAQYKERGILKRLLATPMQPMQFVAANIITRLCMSVTQAVLFVILGMVMFHIQVMGAYWLLLLCVVLGALMFLGLGFTISGLSKTVETVPVLSNVIVLPMMFMGNVFFSNSGMPAWLQAIAKLMPITFLADALRAVMTNGAGPMAVKGEVLGMFVWAVVLITAATLTFRFQKADG